MGEDCCAPSTVMHKRQFQGSLDRKCNTATIQRQNKRSQQPEGLFVWGINLPKNNELWHRRGKEFLVGVYATLIQSITRILYNK